MDQQQKQKRTSERPVAELSGVRLCDARTRRVRVDLQQMSVCGTLSRAANEQLSARRLEQRCAVALARFSDARKAARCSPQPQAHWCSLALLAARHFERARHAPINHVLVGPAALSAALGALRFENTGIPRCTQARINAQRTAL